MTPEDEEFNRIERESKQRMAAVKESMIQPKQQVQEALKALIHEMEYVLSCINSDKVPFDGDDFHEALRLGREALAKQKPQNCGTSYCSCIECVMK